MPHIRPFSKTDMGVHMVISPSTNTKAIEPTVKSLTSFVKTMKKFAKM